MQHLRDLKKRFSNWRASKSTVAEPVPNDLWQEVKRALKYINSSLLCRELRITQYQIRLHCGFAGRQPEPSSYDNKFIEIIPENKKTSLGHISKTTMPELGGLEKHEILFVINNHPITIKLSANNLLAVLRDLKEAL